jgi:RimJ/RimL family protein N-acetyltransferase
MISLETDRLRLRPFTENDLQVLIDLDTDPEVMKYVGGVVTDMEILKGILKKVMDRYQVLKDRGTWVAELKSTGEAIGWFTLRPQPQFQDETEVGYRLKKKFWNQGYATEGTKMLVQYGFEKLKLNKIVAFTHLENQKSQNVLMKSGLKKTGIIPNFFRDSISEEKMTLFEISKN